MAPLMLPLTEETPAADSPASSDVATADAASGTAAETRQTLQALHLEIDISADDLIRQREVPDLCKPAAKEPEPLQLFKKNQRKSRVRQGVVMIRRPIHPTMSPLMISRALSFRHDR